MLKNKLKSLSLFMFTILIAAALIGCGNSNTTTPAETGTSGSGEPAKHDVVTMAMTSAADTLNPYNISGNYGDVIFDQIFDHLVYVTMDGKFLPRLADSWEMSDDYTVATFKLNKNVKWHDGEPFTAEDLVFTAQLVTNKDVISNRRNYFSSVAGTDDNGVAEDPSKVGFVAVDPHTLEIHFKTPTDINAFLALDSTRIYALPKHLLKDADPAKLDADPFFQKPIGTGCFIFDKQVAGERYELTANEDYFLGAPNFNKLVIRVMDAASIVPGLMSGEIDLTSAQGEVPLDDWTLIQDADGIKPAGVQSYGYQYMTINCSKEYFKDARVRRAFSMAINRKNIVDQLLFGEGVIAVGPLANHHPYFNEKIKDDPYDPEAAKALLKEAGWDFNRELEFYVPTGNKVRENSATLIQQDLAAVGVKTKLQVMDFTTQINNLRESKGDLGLLGGAGSVDPDDARVLLSVGTTMSFSHIQDSALFDLATEARNKPTSEQRKPLYYELQEKLVEESPYIWLYHANVLMAHRDIFDNLPIEDFPNLNYAAHTWTFKK
jgi:peptide/nickel transport system substrate-binding protein